MSRQSTKTDNKSIANKIFIRKEAIKDLKEVKVLDLFAGRNFFGATFTLTNILG